MSASLPNITETPIASEQQELIPKVAADAAAFLGLGGEVTAFEIVERVDEFIHQVQLGNRSPPIDGEPDLLFGCLWGEQLVRELGWEWASITFHDHEDVKAIGVFSTDRSLAIYPFHFITGCLKNNAPVTILLSFNMLRDGTRIPPLPKGGYENVMDNVHHIVPRD
jgi:hypothetical protein